MQKHFLHYLIYKIHQFLIFAVIDDGDDFTVLFKIVRADGFVDRGAAVQIVNDEPAKFFFFFGDDADTALSVVVENEAIQNHAVEIRAENTQHHRLFIIDKRGR